MVVQSLLRTKIIDVLKNVQPPNKWKILLVDESSLKVINSALTLSDLTDHFVLRVENMFSARRTPSMEHEAIYFIVPTIASINKVIEDLIPEHSKYAKGHVFLTEKLPTNLSRKIRESRSMCKIGTLKELYVNFTVIDKRTFSLNLPQCLKISYNPSNISFQKYGFQKMAKSLASVLFLMGEKPEVRYYGPPKIDMNSEKDSPAKLLAFHLRQELDSYIDQQFVPLPKAKPFPFTNMLILDRSFDMLSPVMHNSTYMGLLVDLLNFDNMSVITSEIGEEKKVELKDTDFVWRKTKYMHIAKAMENISESLNKFASENKVANWSRMNKDPSNEARKNSTSLKKIEEMKDTLTNLPKYNELTYRYNIHTNLCKAIMNEYNRLSLEDIFDIEQSLAMGFSSTKKSAPTIKNILDFFNANIISVNDMVRILVMYLVLKDGIADSERTQINTAFENNNDVIQIISNLNYLGIRLTSSFLKMVQETKELYYYRHIPDAPKRFTFENDRYTPIIKDVLQTFIKTPSVDNVFHLIPANENDMVQLPMSPGVANHNAANLGEKSLLSSIQAGVGSSSTIFRGKASWATKRNRGGAPDSDALDVNSILNEDKEDEVKTYGNRIIIFVVGGITVGELRAINEVVNSTSRDIIVGSTNLIIPPLFINELEMLNTPLDSADLFGAKSEIIFMAKRKAEIESQQQKIMLEKQQEIKRQQALKQQKAAILTRQAKPSSQYKSFASQMKQRKQSLFDKESSHTKKDTRTNIDLPLISIPSKKAPLDMHSVQLDPPTSSSSDVPKKDQKKKKPWKFI